MKYIKYLKVNIAIIIITMLFATKLSFALDVVADKAILIDYDTSEVVFEKNSQEQTYPSSMAKLMTAYVIFDMLENKELSLGDKFVIAEKAWREEGSRMFLKWGSAVSIDELLHGLIIQSGNDSATALAEGSSEGYEGFVIRMNETAKKLDLKGSSFSNSVGWSDDKTYMTVEDIAILSQRIIKDFPKYYKKYYSQKEYTYNNIRQYNRNWLLTEFEGTDGLKTGYTPEGGYGMAVSAVRDGRRLIAVVNGLNSKRERVEEAKKLLRYGFDTCDRIELFKFDEIGKAKVWMGKKDEVNLVAKDSIFITVEKRYVKDIESKIEYGEYVKAPIKKGDVIAKLIVKAPKGREVSYDLYANEDVRRLGFFGRIWFWIVSFVKGIF